MLYIYIYTYNIYQQKGVIEQLPSQSLWPASQPGVGHGSCDWFGTIMHWNILFWKSIEKDNAKPGTYRLWFCMNWLSCFLSDVWKQTHVTGPFDAARTIQNLKQSASMNRDGRISPSFDSPLHLLLIRTPNWSHESAPAVQVRTRQPDKWAFYHPQLIPCFRYP